MTLNDLERRNRPYFSFFVEIDSFAGQLRHSGWRQTYNVRRLPAIMWLCQSHACEGGRLVVTFNEFGVSKSNAIFLKKIILFQHVHISHRVYWALLTIETYFLCMYSNSEHFCTKPPHYNVLRNDFVGCVATSYPCFLLQSYRSLIWLSFNKMENTSDEEL